MVSTSSLRKRRKPEKHCNISHIYTMANGSNPLYFSALVLLLLLTASGTLQTEAAKTLDIYVMDVEGGNATLVVAPSGQAVLIDSGNLNAAARDAGRIVAAVQEAGIRQIDYLITT